MKKQNWGHFGYKNLKFSSLSTSREHGKLSGLSYTTLKKQKSGTTKNVHGEQSWESYWVDVVDGKGGEWKVNKG